MTNSQIEKTIFTSGDKSVSAAIRDGSIIQLQGIRYLSCALVNSAQTGEQFEYKFKYDVRLISLIACPEDRQGESSVTLTGETETGNIISPFALPMEQVTRFLFTYSFKDMYLFEGDKLKVTIPDNFKLLRLIFEPVLTLDADTFNKI